MAEPSGAVATFLGRAAPYRDGALARLHELVAHESPSGEKALLDVAAGALQRRWSELGFVVETVPGERGDHLVARLPGASSDPSGHVLFLAHYDTVWARGELLEQPFVLEGDRVSGPGTYDMKGGIVALEVAVALLREAGVTPAHDVRVVCIADEEVSSVDGRAVVLEHATGALAALGLEPPHPGGGFKNARRGVARVTLTAHGRAAHAGLDAAQGVSAVDELVDQLRALRDLAPRREDAAINVGTIHGGTRANVVAAEAHAEIGLRFATTETEEALFAALRALRPVRDGARLELNVVSHRPAWQSGDEDWLADYLVRLSLERGDATVAGPAGGAGDANFTGALGIPTVDGLGPNGAHAHAKGEYVELSSLLSRAELLATFLASPLPR